MVKSVLRVWMEWSRAFLISGVSRTIWKIICHKPFVVALALLNLFTGGLSLPSLCHGVRDCSSLCWPIALSICIWNSPFLNSFSWSSNPLWFSSLALFWAADSFCACATMENGLEGFHDWSLAGLLRKVLMGWRKGIEWRKCDTRCILRSQMPKSKGNLESVSSSHFLCYSGTQMDVRELGNFNACLWRHSLNSMELQGLVDIWQYNYFRLIK